jgi:uncharacterized protein YbjT (DUF2867 family)
MERKDMTILVVGATGRQGGAAAKHLKRDGWKVRAMTRNPDSQQAQWLKASGCEVVKANLDNRPQLDVAVKGCYGVFSLQNHWEKDVDEVGQGRRMILAAREAGVKHFVQHSVAAADRSVGLKPFDNKWQIEEYVRDRGLPATVLRPVYLMECLTDKALTPPANWGALKQVLGDSTKLQLIAADDVGAFAALVFREPETYLGASLELAGDELTYPEMVAAHQAALRSKPSSYPMAMTMVKMYSKEAFKMFEWFRESRFQADIPTLRKLYPGLKTLNAFFNGMRGATGQFAVVKPE